MTYIICYLHLQMNKPYTVFTISFPKQYYSAQLLYVIT